MLKQKQQVNLHGETPAGETWMPAGVKWTLAGELPSLAPASRRGQKDDLPISQLIIMAWQNFHFMRVRIYIS
jgi:hypothetical protein